MSEMEIRSLQLTELRAVNGDGAPEIVGYASVFNQVSKRLYGFYELFEPGAYTETLANNPDVKANIEHEGGLLIIGRTHNGTLQLSQDDHGLKVRIKPPDTGAGRDALTLVRGGFIDQMSIAFWVTEETVENDEDYDLPLRRIQAVEIDGGDVTLTGSPAYPQTSAEVRALVESLQAAEDPPLDDSDPAADGGGQDAPGSGTPGGGRNARRLRLAESEI